ncbi:uncharacterized protein LOC110454881 [Mizuhopecten yessoensis]|uniref:SAM domain-containing protein n=1 Tax=Mizuhopecten yessoensis TaxID=6573 RepID=A0A210QE61_MIZYE|nr:uncharacterized protein LOC110454881 [Mizuhopecten yessoensis]OWF47032.1 hypothetical protein KP79_PYT01359 [Mizuhopecten yessoensis]
MMDYEVKTRFPYEYDENNGLNGPKLLKKYRDRFPLLAIVTEGDYGKTVFDDFSDEQVYRIQAYTRQRRVVVKETRVKQDPLKCNYLSFPVDSPYTFCVIKSRNNCTEPMSFSDILKEYTCPVMVKFSPRCKYVKINEMLDHTERIASLLIISEYEENFFTGNCLDKGIINPGVTLAALSPRIVYAEITGIHGKSQETFKKHLVTMERFLRENGVTFDINAGNPAVTRITEEGTGTGNMVPEVLTTLIPELKIKPPPKLPARQTSVQDDKPEKIQNRALPPIPTDNSTQKAVAVVKPYRPQPHEQSAYYTDPLDSEYTYLDVDDLRKEKPENPEAIRKSLKHKSVSDIKKCMLELKLQRYANRFEEELIDGPMFVDLTEDILKEEFKMSKLEIVRLLMFIRTGHIPR